MIVVATNFYVVTYSIREILVVIKFGKMDRNGFVHI